MKRKRSEDLEESGRRTRQRVGEYKNEEFDMDSDLVGEYKDGNFEGFETDADLFGFEESKLQLPTQERKRESRKRKSPSPSTSYSDSDEDSQGSTKVARPNEDEDYLQCLGRLKRSFPLVYESLYNPHTPDFIHPSVIKQRLDRELKSLGVTEVDSRIYSSPTASRPLRHCEALIYALRERQRNSSLSSSFSQMRMFVV